MLFFISIFIIVLILGINNWDNKSFFFLVLIIPITLMIFNIETPDSLNYSSLYHSVAIDGIDNESEIGMQIIMYIMIKLNFDFNTFIKIFYLVALCLLGRFFFKWSQKPSIALLLYIVYPLFLDIVQIRTLMASAIALNAIEFLKDFNKKNIIKYIILVTIAGSLHYSAFFYLIFLLCFLSMKLLIIISAACVSTFLFMEMFLINYLEQIFPFLDTQLSRYTAYNNNISDVSVAVLIVSYILNILICILYYRYIQKRQYVKENLDTINLILKINILSVCLIPFTIFALEFMRIYRLVMILDYSIAGNLMPYNPCSKKVKLFPLFICLLVIFSGFVSFYRYIYIDHMEDVVYELFYQNYFWRGIFGFF